MTDARPTAGRVLGSEGVRSRLADPFDAEPVDLTELDGGTIGTVSLAACADRDPVVANTGETPLSAEAAMLGALAPHLPVPEVYHATTTCSCWSAFRASRRSRRRPNATPRSASPTSTPRRPTRSGSSATRSPVRQPNPRTDSWPAFFRDHRVPHAAEGARAAGELPAGLHERVRSAAADFESLLREPPTPALVHAWPFGERHADELDRTLAGLGY